MRVSLGACEPFYYPCRRVRLGRCHEKQAQCVFECGSGNGASPATVLGAASCRPCPEQVIGFAPGTCACGRAARSGRARPGGGVPLLLVCRCGVVDVRDGSVPPSLSCFSRSLLSPVNQLPARRRRFSRRWECANANRASVVHSADPRGARERGKGVAKEAALATVAASAEDGGEVMSLAEPWRTRTALGTCALPPGCQVRADRAAVRAGRVQCVHAATSKGAGPGTRLDACEREARDVLRVSRTINCEINGRDPAQIEDRFAASEGASGAFRAFFPPPSEAYVACARAVLNHFPSQCSIAPLHVVIYASQSRRAVLPGEPVGPVSLLAESRPEQRSPPAPWSADIAQRSSHQSQLAS
ncbi:hypothetical protein C8Q79DRAFT_128478 [Trametes meyenii]|nr:hypothetical protein C8Q79DRAFT_128478 [Trametes meyenii]